MSAPGPLSAAELRLLATSVLERVELVAMTAELGGSLAERTVASAVASAIELHRELARTMDAGPADHDGDLIVGISRTIEQLNDALAVIARPVGAPHPARPAEDRRPAEDPVRPSRTPAFPVAR